MATQEILAQIMRLQNEERRFLAEFIWETVDRDLPARWTDESTIANEVESRFAAFKSGHAPGLTHEEVFSAARALL
jgi:putative addiction module component (TIGR02574 family)